MNSPSSLDNARLDALLRDSATQLPDDGFSARVVASLPALRPKHRAFVRQGFTGVGALAGTLIAIYGATRRPAVPVDFFEVSDELNRATQAFFDPRFGLALLVTVACLLFVFRPRWRFEW